VSLHCCICTSTVASILTVASAVTVVVVQGRRTDLLDYKMSIHLAAGGGREIKQQTTITRNILTMNDTEYNYR